MLFFKCKYCHPIAPLPPPTPVPAPTPPSLRPLPIVP